MPILPTLIAVALIALVLCLVGRCHFLRGSAGPALLSASGGFAVAYVFVDVLPKLASKQEVLLRTADQGILRFLEHHAYVVALAGLVVFFGVSLLSQAQLATRKANEGPVRPPPGMLLKVAAYCAYVALVGYLVVDRLDQSLNALVLYTLAMSIHLLGVAHKLRQYETEIYDHLSRWMLVVSLVAGWAAGALSSLPERFVALWVSFLAGALVIVAIRDELPRDRDVRYLPFLGGAVTFSLLAFLAEAL